MADGSVAAEQGIRVTQPDYIYSDGNPYERNVVRLKGIRAMATLSICALDDPEGGPPTPMVWSDIWMFLGIVAEDIDRDMLALWEEKRTKQV